MKERPILFSAPMVRAILAGTKTHTRRVVKPMRGFEHNNVCRPDMVAEKHAVWWHGKYKRVGCLQECPYGKPGDRLWVRETWQAIHVYKDTETGCGGDVVHADRIPTSNMQGWWSPFYAATDPLANDLPEDRGFPWRPAIHMPRWASRITLEVTAVRVERLQEISEADCFAEGITSRSVVAGDARTGCTNAYSVEGAHDSLSPRGSYELLWESINGPRSWDANPFVWVVEFRRLQTSGIDLA